jgi:hypothetical protein
MSNLTIGKIVNNSATLILNSTDQDGFGEKIITGNNFRKLGSYNPASTYQVKTDDFYAKQPYSETFFQYINGPIADQTVVDTYDNFVVGKYYAIKTKGIGDLNKAGNVGTTAPIPKQSAQYILYISGRRMYDERVCIPHRFDAIPPTEYKNK